jgi:hypothetical protein
MTQLRSFILRGCSFLALATALLWALTWCIDQGLRHSEHDDYIVWNSLMNGKASADIIINGNSHAASQTDPAVLEKKLGYSAYNIGLDGQDLDLQLMRYHTYRRYNKKPRIIIQVADFSSLNKSTRLLNRMQYLPYLKEDVIYQSLHPLGISFWDRHFPVLKYRGIFPTAKLGVLEWLNLRQERSARCKGYLPHTEAWTPQIDTFIGRERYYFAGLGYAPQTAAAARDFLNRNRQEGIITFVVVPPQYHSYTAHFPNRMYYWGTIRREVLRYGCHFLNYQEDSMCYHKSNFTNATHLNVQGANLFSEKLAANVAEILSAYQE